MIDWKKHPKAAYADVTFFDKHHCDVGSQLDISRPTQTKTVADAVEWQLQAGNEIAGYAVIGLDTLTYCNEHDNYHFVNPNSEAGKGLSEYYQVIGTREQFEAYVKEQEGEKWTHTTSSGHKCKIYANEPDKRGAVVVVNSEGYYMLDCAENLKPIEYVISKSEAWDRLNSGEFYCMEYGVSKLKQLYDII